MKVSICKVFMISLLVTACATQAYALTTPEPMNLNYILGSSPVYANGSSFGTVSLKDNVYDQNKVDINVNLFNQEWKILGLYLNYSDIALKDLNGSIKSTDGKKIDVSINNQKAGGYSSGYFDLQDPARGNLGYLGSYDDTLYASTSTKVLNGYQQKITGYEQKIIRSDKIITGYEQKVIGYRQKWSHAKWADDGHRLKWVREMWVDDTSKPIYGDDKSRPIYATKPVYGDDKSKPIYADDITKPVYATQTEAFDLDALKFYMKDTSSNFFAAVHIGNYDGCNSIWVAAGDASAAPVPEPGTMVLLGIGMLGMAVYGKRRINKEA